MVYVMNSTYIEHSTGFLVPGKIPYLKQIGICCNDCQCQEKNSATHRHASSCNRMLASMHVKIFIAAINASYRSLTQGELLQVRACLQANTFTPTQSSNTALNTYITYHAGQTLVDIHCFCFACPANNRPRWSKPC